MARWLAEQVVELMNVTEGFRKSCTTRALVNCRRRENCTRQSPAGEQVLKFSYIFVAGDKKVTAVTAGRRNAGRRTIFV